MGIKEKFLLDKLKEAGVEITVAVGCEGTTHTFKIKNQFNKWELLEKQFEQIKEYDEQKGKQFIKLDFAEFTGKSIPKDFCKNNANLIGARFNHNLEKIKENAFKGCFNLRVVHMPASLSFEEGVFDGIDNYKTENFKMLLFDYDKSEILHFSNKLEEFKKFTKDGVGLLTDIEIHRKMLEANRSYKKLYGNNCVNPEKHRSF
jgi:hypothetical protein